ncbi:MAG TPA: S8 family serine peptidase [Chthoniobacterales bacterium]|nr:S8 family serine peptidase [Chthoniobacterales bacterium]
MNRSILTACILALAVAAQGQSTPAGPSISAVPVPENLGLGLKQLVEISQTDPAALRNRMSASRSIASDISGRVIVNIQLNGERPFAEVEAKLAALGAEIFAADPNWRGGAISAWLPISQSIPAATLPGVRSIALARKPIRRVGAVTAGSSVVEHAAEVNTPGVVTPQGILGRGISVGLVSDSYDTASGVPRASAGVASGDLPGPGNPNGHTQPVIVLKDEAGFDGADEGRAMAEIVHDIAPAAKLSFSAAGQTQVAMAASIRNLRTHPQTLCDVIVDDIGFAEEPFFSDGIIAQAVDDVATSNSLPGKKVAYFSAAGNSGNRGYSADANIISVAASGPYRGNLRFTNVPAALYAGGFHNLNANGTPALAMTVTTGTEDALLVLQWDDPFNSGAVTTNYNLLVFTEDGSYLGTISGTDNNLATSQPLEFVDLNPNTTYQLVICLGSSAPPNARHLRMISFGGNAISGDYLTDDVMVLFGHPAAANANAVAAYVYNNRPNVVSNYNPGMLNPPPGPYEPALEGFNSRGGDLPFYFNAQGQRLNPPELRPKPEFAAADGVDTSFFPAGPGSDFDNNGFPNFFGTSAAAPNAAGFAALLLEATGGPNSLTPAQVRDNLKRGTYPHDLDPHYSHAYTTFGEAGNQYVAILTAAGDDSNESATSPNFLNLSFSSQNNITLAQVTIDLSLTSLVFDPRADVGFPFTVGQNTGNVSVTATLSPDLRILILDFGDTFTSNQSISFGIDRDLAGINAGGNSADLLGGASVAVTTKSNSAMTSTRFNALSNQLGHDFVPTDGEGLIDVRAAIEPLVGGPKPAFSGVAANLSTRGVVGAGDDVLIGGMIFRGITGKRIVTRAIGPSLPVAGRLPDPVLELHDAFGATIATNDNWQDDPSQAAELQATGLAPAHPHESAIVQTLDPSPYTAIVRGANSTSGIGLVEFYDLDSQASTSFLENIATRGNVQGGDDVMIAGFILQQATSQIVVRAIGPSIAGQFPAGAKVLDDPLLELRDHQGNLLMLSDNWQENAFQAVQLASTLAPSSAVESAFITTLSPNNYTVIVRGAHGTTGLAVVEVYNVR